MRDVLVMLFEAFALCWVALILFGLAYSLVRWLRTPTKPWWDLDEPEHPDWSAARADYVGSLRIAQQDTRDRVRRQPVRDEVLRLVGQSAPRDAA